jgi:hypothetical protein
MTPLGYKPSYYRRLFERLLCEVKPPRIFLAGELLQSAISNRTCHPWIALIAPYKYVQRQYRGHADIRDVD